MKIVGYTDRWSVRSGDVIRFFVSCHSPQYQAQLVRLRHGDESPRGPGPRSVPIEATCNGTYPGREQSIATGSYVRVDHLKQNTADFCICAWIYPTAPKRGPQGIITRWDPVASRGFGLRVNASGVLEGWVGTGDSARIEIACQQLLQPDRWYFVALAFDAVSGTLRLRSNILRPSPFEVPQELLGASVSQGMTDTPAALLLGASYLDGQKRQAGRECFNGKISAPMVSARSPTKAELTQLNPTELIEVLRPGLLAKWDFTQKPSSRTVVCATGQEEASGTIINRPTRSVTGHNWSARTDSYVEAPQEYNAVHFHDDDLEDANWDEDFRWTIPETLQSGIYAMAITGADGAQDSMPFFVRTHTGRPAARIAVLIPTLSYLAYSNSALNFDAMDRVTAASAPLRNNRIQLRESAYIASVGLKSTYDVHTDGSGVCHATLLRPSLTSMRANHRTRTIDAPHQLSADLHLIDWLEAQNFSYDAITDHDLHREGVALLKPYKAVLTGTHAEYWTREMLTGLEEYEQAGGRVVYLSGNGLYWVTALDPETNTVCEVRRTNGTRTWTTPPGEGRLAFTGEPGGLWALRGLPPQRFVGVGMAAQGFDRGAGYKRTEASRNPRAAFIFDGIEQELIGDVPALALNHGAAGFEVDRVDYSLGTPRHALVLATSLPLSDSYQGVIEDSTGTAPYQGGITNENVRADMVFYETPNNGAVFSVGSISFCSTLSYNNYDNTSSHLLANVIQAFSRDGALPGRPYPIHSTH